jgi:hypothetical protein
MGAAASELEKPDVAGAVPNEESALASLVGARQNLRKLLKENPSASACRSIDRQHQQKIRRPPPKDNDQQLAKLPEEIKKLAREERSICQGMSPSSSQGASKNDAGSQASNGSETQAKGSESKENPVERQSRAAQTAAELQKKVHSDPAMSSLAKSRMDEAVKAVQQAAESLRAGDRQKGAEKASRAADQLERLAEQVAGLKSRELAATLARARELAHKLAGQEQSLADQFADRAKPGGRGRDSNTSSSPGRNPADQQREAADETETLADWLRKLEGQAGEESRELAQSLRKASQANPPGEIADAMRAAADAMQAGKREGASEKAGGAARQLEARGRELESARRAFVQPRLDQLVAAEKEAARAQSALRSVRDAHDQAMAEKALADLVKSMESMTDADARLAAAAGRLADGLRNHGGWGGRRQPSDGEFEPGRPT